MSHTTKGLYAFGPFRLDPAARTLTRDGNPIALAPKTFDLLLMLVESEGRVLQKRTLMVALWPDTIVEEANLSFQISTLRKALQDDDHTLIETVPRHGYRFTAHPERSGVEHVAVAVPLRLTPHTQFARWHYLAALAAGILLCSLGYIGLRRRGSERPVEPPSAPIRLTAYLGSEGAPSFSPDGSHVAFAWDGNPAANFDIYVKVAGEGEPFRLTSDPADEVSPAWSPDGRSIAFLRLSAPELGTIYIKPALGGAERKVLDVAHRRSVMSMMNRIAWVPDGKSLVIGGTLTPRGEAGLRIVSIADGTSRVLTTPIAPGGVDLSPSFDRDGRRLAFVRWKEILQGDVYLMHLAPDYSPASPPIPVTSEDRAVCGLAWTPDGRSVIYSTGPYLGVRSLRKADVTATGSRPGASSQALSFGEQALAVTVSSSGKVIYSRDNHSANIWSVSLDGPGTVAGPPTRLIASTLHNHLPDYSPDGKQIAFTSTRSGTEEIWIAASDGSNPVRLTHFEGPVVANPRWSPDGKQILFHSRASGTMKLYILNPTTSAVRRLTPEPVEEGQGAWSRDGKFVYFTSLRSGRFEIWRMPSQGGPVVRVSDFGGAFAQESVDGKTLYVAAGTTIRSLPRDGGASEQLLADLAHSLDFAVAENGIYYMADVPGSVSSVVRYYDFTSRKSSTILNTGKRFWFGMALSPERKHLLYSVVDSADSDLVLIDRF